MGGSKHLISIEGAPMLEYVLRELQRSRVASTTVVLRPGDVEGRELAKRLGCSWVEAEQGERGRAASVAAAVAATDASADGLLFALADQPYLLAADFDALVADFAESPSGIVRATYDGEPGSPVLFARRFFAELRALGPREGGRVVAARHPELVRGVALDPERGRDLDRPEDLS